MSDKRNRARPRRVFSSWIRALEVAVNWGYQTGQKWRVRRVRAGAFVIERTEREYVRDFSPGASRRLLDRWERWKPRRVT